MGHADYSMECVGFILTFQRGAQWAATGKVTLSDIPDDFPDAQTVRQRSLRNPKINPQSLGGVTTWMRP